MLSHYVQELVNLIIPTKDEISRVLIARPYQHPDRIKIQLEDLSKNLDEIFQYVSEFNGLPINLKVLYKTYIKERGMFLDNDGTVNNIVTCCYELYRMISLVPDPPKKERMDNSLFVQGGLNEPHLILQWILENFKSIEVKTRDDLLKDKYYLFKWHTGSEFPHFTVFNNGVVHHYSPLDGVERMTIQNYIRCNESHHLINVFEVLKPQVNVKNYIQLMAITVQENCLTFCFKYLGLEYIGKDLINPNLFNDFEFTSQRRVDIYSLFCVCEYFNAKDSKKNDHENIH